MPQLTRLFYASRATKEGALRAISEILPVARDFNSKNNITGLLTFDGEYFTQVLEGPASIVNALMEKIAKDPRHENVRILYVGPILTRDFGEWSMGYVYDIKFVQDVESFMGIERPDFNEVAHFIEDLRDYVSKL
ncbi:BLUF domain-containing protein [Comamonadaceae bacterium PP-2]